MSTKHIFSLVAFAAFVSTFSTPGHADVVQGTGSGSFSSLTGCSTGGFYPTCGLANGNEEVKWGTTNLFVPLLDPSTLTANTQTINSPADATNVKLAELTWFNSPESVIGTPGQLGVDYKLTIAFTAPAASSATETFDLTITNTLFGSDTIAGFTLGDLSGLTFNLPGVTVSDLHYVAADGSALLGSSCSARSTGTTWCNPEGNTGELFIEATLTDPPIDVPAPTSLAFVATGLVGFSLLRRQTVTLRARR